jgi:hypothetical protein
MGTRDLKPQFLNVACSMKSVHYLEFLENETLLFMVPIKEVPTRVKNSSAIHAQLRSAIELTQHYNDLPTDENKVKLALKVSTRGIGY